MSSGNYKSLLKHFGFQSFLCTQFLGAFNDNIYKMVVSLFAVEEAVRTGNGGSMYLSLTGVVFILPFLMFSGYAGHAADVFNKRSVLIVTKSFEIVAMGLAVIALWSGRIDFMLFVLFLMALQSTFFSPAKYGIIPEMLSDRDLSRANGLLEMSTFLAIIIGTAMGGFIFGMWKDRISLISLFVVATAVIGTITSFGISRVPNSGASNTFRLSPWGEISIGLKRLYSNKLLFMTVIGISYLWFIGALLQMDILLIGKEVMRLDDKLIGLLVAFLAIGIGAGGVLAGRLSGDRIEPGLVPVGSLCMGLFSIVLSYATPSFVMTALSLIFLGFAGGIFVVPLNALLQQKSGAQEKGRMIAANNFVNTIGVLFASGMLWLLRDLLGVSPAWIAFITGVFSFAVTIIIISELPDFLIRFVLYTITHTVYRIRITGEENIPVRGPAVLVSNHISFADPFFIGSSVPGFVRFLVTRDYYDIKSLQWFFRLMKAIPLSANSRRDIVSAIEQARKELQNGNVVCIFAEGEISRTGHIRPFKRGIEKITEGLDVPVIPVHLDSVWGSIFSFRGRKFFYKWPERLFRPVTVSFGKPLASDASAQEIRQAIMELGCEAAANRRKSTDLLHLRFIRTARRNWKTFCMADSGGRRLTYGKALTESLLLSIVIRRRYRNEPVVGIMLPPSVGGALANIASLMAGKAVANLDFTAGADAIASAIRQSGIRTILTSRIFMEKIQREKPEGMVFLEDIQGEAPVVRNIIAAAMTRLLPLGLLNRLLNIDKSVPGELAVLVFSGWSTGLPKGIMLSHGNIVSNVEGIEQVFNLNNEDRLMGVLPFSSSFGVTATIWFPLITGSGVVYHSDPVDARTIGGMVSGYKATVLITTPAYCSSYISKCTREEFSSLRYVVAGAEKRHESNAAEFRDKFGLELLEGYCCTEMGSVVSVNTPDIVHGNVRQRGNKPGTVGHPIPGVAVRIVDVDTGEALPCGAAGMLLVKGPGQMTGYMKQPGSSDGVIKDGWYITGDIASIDRDGFITIKDRLAGFSNRTGSVPDNIMSHCIDTEGTV
ncbi:MAG: MFS transporter [Nitrospirae bacterium]|nr:MFS transporter [Nitrospirota bacterium]